MDEIAKWGWAIALLINMVLGWLLWSVRSAFVPRSEFADLKTDVELVKRDVEHLPTADDLNQLRGAVSKLEGQADAQEQLLNRIAASVTRIEDYLLKSKVT